MLVETLLLYCASHLQQLSKALGLAIAKSGMGFVYGGGKKGIMGTVSGAALDAGAKVTGKSNIE